MEKSKSKKIIKFLLICGILSTLLYISSDVICSMVYPGYSYTEQAISELYAIGDPTTNLWKILTFLYNPLIILFGAGVFFSSGKKRSLKVT